MQLSFISCLLVASSLIAGEADAHRRHGAWRSAVIGGGGYLQEVAWAPGEPRRLYLASDVGGCFRSDDAGATWRMLHGGLPANGGCYEVRGILADPRDRDVVLIATSDGIWASRDAGSTWRRTLAAWFAGNGEFRWTGRILVRSPADPEVVLAAAPGAGAFRSDDGGMTWRRTGVEDVWPTDLAFDRGEPAVVRLCARARKGADLDGRRRDLDGGIWESRDSGSAWTRIAAVAPTEVVQDPMDAAVWYGLDPDRQVMRSRDGMRTWEGFASGLPARTGWARDDGVYDAIAAADGEIILAGHGAHIYRLDRGAGAWRPIVREGLDEGAWWGASDRHGYQHFGSALAHLGVDPGDPTHWLVTDWYALYQSRDAGRTWRLRIDGIEMTVAHCLLQDPSDPARAHLGLADIGYMRSDDRGGHWTGMRPGISNNIKHIAASTVRPGRLWAVGPQSHEWHANQVFSSDDGGGTWRRAAMRGLPDMARSRCNSIPADPRDARGAWLAVDGPVAPGAGGIWRTTDDGDTWTWAGQGLPAAPALFRRDIWVSGPELATSPDGSLVAAANDHGRMFRRTPGADAWSAIDTAGMGGRPNAVIADPRSPARFYACRRDGGLWRSDDGGRAWRRVLAADASAVAVDVADPSRLVVNGGGGVQVSDDAGASWRVLPPGLPYRHPRNVVAWAGGLVVIATGGNGVFTIDPAAAVAPPR